MTWLDDAGLEMISRAGIRKFHDYLVAEHKDGAALEQLLALEVRLRAQEPYASRARQFHLVYRWKGS
jgi:S-adenosylmethionine-dependent methyltransferase